MQETGEVASKSVLVVGEALIDRVFNGRGLVNESPGGSPAVVAVTLGRLGRHPTLWTSLGKDQHGSDIRHWLLASAVDVVNVGPPTSNTATASAVLDAHGSARYDIEIDWAIVGEPEAAADIVHIGSVSTLLQPGADVVLCLVKAVRPRSIITFDPNIRPALVGDSDFAITRVETLVDHADVVKASDADVAWLYPHRSVDEVGRAWLARGAGLVVITQGAGGAVAFTQTGRIDCRAVDVTVVDTIGAGDTFMGALIDGLIESDLAGVSKRAALRAIRPKTVQAILERCIAAAAITVSRAGANPPWRSEFLDLRGGEIRY